MVEETPTPETPADEIETEVWDGVERRLPENAKKREQGNFILDLLDRHDAKKADCPTRAPHEETEEERQKRGAAELEAAKGAPTPTPEKMADGIIDRKREKKSSGSVLDWN